MKRAKDKKERAIAKSLMHNPVYTSKQEHIFLRPYLEKLNEFLEINKDYCDYGFWTSATEINANLLYDLIRQYGFKNPKFLWNQSYCRVIGHNGVKPLFVKEIKHVWEAYEEYSEKNVILIDDDDYKSTNKENFINIDKYDVTTEDSLNDDALKRLVKYLKRMNKSIIAGRTEDCVSYLKKRSFKV
jgi:hypothetical protein